MERRDFLKKGALAAAILSTAGLTACRRRDPFAETSGSSASGEYADWKMVTAWPPNFPVYSELLHEFAELVKSMTGGRFIITVYAGGELVPPLEGFDAVRQGTAQLCHDASYYHSGKIPAAQFFTAIPFGLNTNQMYAWLYYGGGLKLWEELYAGYGLFPIPSGNTGGQMGGWFRKEINSVKDLDGIKMRIPGIGGRVMSKLGVATVLASAAESYTNLERGVIDALEWVGPYHDYKMGFNRIAKYYYYPGWQEPCGQTELVVNKSAYDSLPKDYQAVLSAAADYLDQRITAMFFAKNAEYYRVIKDEGKTVFKKFSDDTLAALREKTAEVLDEIVSKDPASKKIYDSYKTFQKSVTEFNALSEINYIP
ncbi:MAG: TRAP transporter substrate-binding protein DctP [Ignavibacteriaceae bacterium]|nr:TRAP transporter substrate-binding protein DctP [Ignavibacteriaceae bacterium]